MRLRDVRDEVERRGARLAAISTDPPADTRTFEQQLEADGETLGFPLFCDPSKQTVKAFGVYDAAHDIALPSVIVLDGAGKVVWKYVADSVTDRPAEERILEALDAAGGK